MTPELKRTCNTACTAVMTIGCWMNSRIRPSPNGTSSSLFWMIWRNPRPEMKAAFSWWGHQAERVPMARRTTGAFPLRFFTASTGTTRHVHFLPFCPACAGSGQRYLRLCPDSARVRTRRPETVGRISGAPVRPSSGRPSRHLPIWQVPKAENVSTNNDLVCQAAADILERTGALRRGLETAILVSTKNQALVIKGWLTDHGIPAEVCDDVPVGVDSPLGKTCCTSSAGC